MKNAETCGDFQVVAENLTKLNIVDFVRQANSKLRETLIGGNLEANGLNIKLKTSKTGFGGERLWFDCPMCQRRAGVLYRRLDGLVGCRSCLGLKYRSQKYKGMVELDIQ